ncbi:MAG: hypothetical protein R3C26_26510 [Calditrichia bacterium]
MAKNIAELRNNYRCIAVDLPGYGKSSKGPYPIGMAFYADVLAQFLVKLISRAPPSPGTRWADRL